MERLRHIRQERTTFDGRFYEKHDDFWPIARAARTFADRDDWPDVADYASAFDGEAPVRFELAPPRRRRSTGEPVVVGNLYDSVIVERGVVPTRPRMWHDYLNALVWATYPRAKLALHRRQHAAIARWVPAGATQLPNARTRELDALALVDEGGVLVLGGTTLLFGHALYEGLVLGQPAMIARSVTFDAAPNGDIVAQADALLAALLSDPSRVCSPDELARVPLT